MKRDDLLRELEEVINVEDTFVENLSSLNITISNHATFADEETMRKIKSGFEGLLSGSERHMRLMKELRMKIKSEEKDEY